MPSGCGRQCGRNQSYGQVLTECCKSMFQSRSIIVCHQHTEVQRFNRVEVATVRQLEDDRRGHSTLDCCMTLRVRYLPAASLPLLHYPSGGEAEMCVVYHGGVF
eukprot:1604749-Amphidinium_carterae.2